MYSKKKSKRFRVIVYMATNVKKVAAKKYSENKIKPKLYNKKLNQMIYAINLASV